MTAPASQTLIPFDGETELGFTKWHTITQEQIDLFAEASLDHDPMHVDVEHAANGPFGTTLAFGFQTMSLLTFFSHQIFSEWAEKFPALAYALNYGFDRVRLVAPVPVNSRIRAHFTLKDVQPKGETGTLMKINARIEIEGSDRPALTAEWLFVAYPEDAVEG
jgi:acyl dehydratase